MSNGTATTRNKDGGASETDHSTTDHLARKAHETINRVADTSAEAETRIRERAEAAADKLRAGEERAKEAAERSVDQMSAYVQKNPLMSAGIAFVAGIFISSLMRR